MKITVEDSTPSLINYNELKPNKLYKPCDGSNDMLFTMDSSGRVILICFGDNNHEILNPEAKGWERVKFQEIHAKLILDF